MLDRETEIQLSIGQEYHPWAGQKQQHKPPEPAAAEQKNWEPAIGDQ